MIKICVLVLLAGCIADPNPLITVTIPTQSIRSSWNPEPRTAPRRMTYRLEMIWVRWGGAPCLMSVEVGRGVVESCDWTSNGLRINIRRQPPISSNSMQWVFSRGLNEPSLTYPFLPPNDTRQFYPEPRPLDYCRHDSF